MNYQYTAKSTSGETTTGLLEATSLAEVQQQLRERDLFVVSAKPLSRKRLLGTGSGALARAARVSKRDLMTLTSQLAIMARTGVDLATALHSIAEQCPHAALKRTLQQVHEEILAGKSVSAALAKYDHVFGQSYVASVAAAEAAGRLPEVLKRLADLLRSQLRMRSTLRTLLVYPILLTSVSLLVIFALMFFVLPQFAAVFKQMDVPLPAVTQVLIDISAELRSRYLLWGGLCAAVLVMLVVFWRTRLGRRCIDSLLVNMIMIRSVTRSLLIGRAFRLLGTMIASGVPLLDGLRLTRSSIRNSLFRELLDDVEHEVLNGRGLGSTFLESPIVPAAASQMVATAERTGTLATVTQLMGEFYEEDGETRLRELATVLEPVIIVLMGVVVALVVLSVMLPVFDFASLAK